MKVGNKPCTISRVSLIFWHLDNYIPLPENHEKLDCAHNPIQCHDRRCCNPEHLSWKTASDNAKDKILDGTLKLPDIKGSKHCGSKLNEDQVRDIKKQLEENEKICILAKKYGVNSGTIYDIRNGKTWKHI